MSGAVSLRRSREVPARPSRTRGVTGVPPGGMKCSVAEFMLDKGKLSQTWSNQPSGRRVLISLSLAKERVAMSKDPGVLKE